MRGRQPLCGIGRHVFDRADFQADGLQRADGGFTAGAGTFDADFDFLHAVRHRLAGGVLRDLLRGVGRALARAFETDAAGAGPADQVALHVGDGDLRVVESGENVRDAGGDILRVLGLDDLLGIGIFAQKFGSGRRGDRRRFRKPRRLQPAARGFVRSFFRSFSGGLSLLFSGRISFLFLQP